ncbi:MAG: hypothetical protein ABL951_08980 [Alphaproteobacteria bacterium]
MIKLAAMLLIVLLASPPPVRAERLDVAHAARCTVLEPHVPDADVSYQPGRDSVAGRRVVPADIEGSEAAGSMPQNFEIEIDADPYTSADPESGMPAAYLPRAKIGRVQVRDLEGGASLSFNERFLYRSPSGTAAPDCAR